MPSHQTTDGEVIDSTEKIFTLGFVSPGKSTKRYVGIWYYQDPDKAIVWVANRDDPINDRSEVLSINNGNLVLSEKKQTVIVWSTNVSVTSTSNTTAQLLDTGNLVLVERDTKKTLWQGFDHLTNTLIPFMKLGLDRQRSVNWSLTSWKSPDDPGTGNYSYRFDPTGFPQLSLYRGPDKIWRTGSWTGQRLIGIPEIQWSKISFSTFEDNEDELYSMYGVTNSSVRIRLVLNESGVTQRFSWDKRWIQFASAPMEQCDYYGNCGANSNCNPYNVGNVDFECTCLPGYEPENPQSWFYRWFYRDGSDGCRRKQGMSTCQKGEGFVKVARLKVPDTNVTHVDLSLGLKECERKCLSNCSCLAYTSAHAESEGGATGCLTYHGNMMDARTYTNTGQDFYVRVNATELSLYKKNGSLLAKKTIVILSLVALLFTITLMFSFFRRKKKRKAKYRTSSFNLAASSTYLDDSFDIQEQDGNTRDPDLPMFDLRTIVAATDNFSTDNKLGEGGFGSVYKVWNLWNEGKSIEIVDKALGESYPADEVLRCIQIGLLCVQEQAIDRPTMSAVIFMLGNVNGLPSPKQPAFIGNKTSFVAGSSTSEGVGSVNEVTISMFQGR
ncbi:hypothetical protein Pint_10808 [Pistacia integerrima]|uniref:Uncharacterized protein n=1 Tax=Pistacia integerrima TaxID=434235 RepID=A0ACC0XKQ9_9ROSI|nr:hypothetical protein Pint_10808 [Pistacia integerrima]